MNDITQYKDEISILDLVKILTKWKYIISLIFLTIVGFSVFYLLSKQAVYESRAVIIIGNYGASGQLIEKASILKRRLESSYQVDEPDYNEIKKYPYPKLASVNVESNSEDFIALVTHANSPEEAQSYLKSVINKVISQHKKNLKEFLLIQTKLLESQTELLDSMLIEVDSFGKLVDDVSKKDSTKSVLLKLEQLKFNERLPQINASITQLAFKIDSAKETRIIKEPVFNEDSIKPKRLLVIAIGIIMGLFLGVFVAFFIEIFVCIKKQLVESK